MSFQGNLSNLGVLDLLSLLNQWRMTGVLSVIAKFGERGLVFDKGDLVYATASESSRRLGSFLVRLGFLTPNELTATGEMSPFAPGHFGQKLLKAGRISVEQLKAAVKAQIVDIVDEIVTWKDPAFFFDDHMLPFSPPREGLVSVPSVILEAAKRTDDLRYARSVFPDGNIVLAKDPAVSEPHVAARHTQVLELVDGSRTIEQILFSSPRGPRSVVAALSELLENGVVRRAGVKVPKTSGPVVPEIKRVATAPHMSATIFDIFNQKEIKRPQICKVLAQEPLLTLKLLKLLTLSNVKLERSDLTVHRLVQHLGTFQTRYLLLPEAARNLHFPQSEYYWRECWQHDQMCADLCEKIALATQYPFPGEAYLAGLLHNIGAYILFTASPREYRCVAMKSLTRKCSMESLEEEHFGISHTRIGGIYARKWQFPSMLRIAIREHHAVESIPWRYLPHIVYVADTVTQEYGCRIGYNEINRKQFRHSLEHVGLDEKDLVSLFADTQRKILGEFLERESCLA